MQRWAENELSDTVTLERLLDRMPAVFKDLPRKARPLRPGQSVAGGRALVRTR
jgi:hypothetical protein